MAKTNAFKLTLKTGKTVMLREVKIKHQSLAAKAASLRSGDGQMSMAIEMQAELIKLLLISVNDKPVSGAALEDLDALFTFREYNQVSAFIAKLIGGDEKNECQMEIVTTGDQ